MLNANDVRVNRAYRQDMERAARKQQAARDARKPKTPAQARTAWARLTNLFL